MSVTRGFETKRGLARELQSKMKATLGLGIIDASRRRFRVQERRLDEERANSMTDEGGPPAPQWLRRGYHGEPSHEQTSPKGFKRERKISPASFAGGPRGGGLQRFSAS